jgi:predicted nucleic acid-binding protein
LEPFARGLDEGEKSVIAFAGTFPPPVGVLMDDAAGRTLARRAGLDVLGFAGLLIKGRERGLVDRVVPLLLDARNHGYWLDDALIETVRRLTGE